MIKLSDDEHDIINDYMDDIYKVPRNTLLKLRILRPAAFKVLKMLKSKGLNIQIYNHIGKHASINLIINNNSDISDNLPYSLMLLLVRLHDKEEIE